MMLYNCYNYKNEMLQPGDIVFFKSFGIFSGNFVNAITGSSANKKPIFHIAMITKSDSEAVSLIDASPESGVQVKEYKNLCKTHGYFQDIEVARVDLDPQYRQLAVDYALDQLGAEYNDLFWANLVNSRGHKSFYCSQLVQFAYNNAGAGNIFPDIPMNFHDDDGEYSEYWLKYYHEKSESVPQGMPGSHPATLYEAENLIHL